MTLLHQVVRADTPAVYWPFDELADGAVCRDQSGNGRNGTEVATGASLASTGIVPGHPKSCVNVGDGYWSFANVAALDVGTGDFTHEIWLKITNTTANYVEIASRDSSATGNGQILNLNITTGGVGVWCGGTALNCPTRISDDRLHHVIFRRIAGVVSVFVDGVQDGTVAAAGGTDVAARPLRVGVADGTYARPLGRWAHYAYYTTGLTDAQVLVHYRAGLRDGVSY